MSNMDNNIKIFVSHRIDFDSIKIENDVFIPVRCGACFDKRKDTNIIGDNTGINISNKRESYCELTVQYWAWKNIDADYYGICHYRRYLSFNEKAASDLNDWSNIVLPNINSKIIDQHFLNNIDYIKNKVSSYDVVTMIPVDLRKVDRKSVYEQYQKDGVRLHISDIDIMLNIIDERYPEFSDIAHSYMYGSVAYIGNIFIMKKEFFHNYCSWLFDILSEFEKRVDMSNYSMEAYRTPGHLGERLFGIYYTWLKKNKNIKALELPLLLFNNTAAPKKITPSFFSHSIPIIFSTSEQYSIFCATSIQSIINSSSASNNYDIFILTKNISKATKKKFLYLIEKHSNFSIQFIDITNIISQYNLYESPTISCETYFRLTIPEIFSCYDKIIYLDSDIIVKRDIENLYKIDIKDYWIGAVQDICEAGVVNGFNDERKEYVKNYMKLKNIYKEFNAGVLLLNLDEFRKNFSTRYLLEFCEAGAFQFQDQDALNIICEGKVLWLDVRWNFSADPIDSYRGWAMQYAPREVYKSWLNAANDPWIIHYAGNEKPWWNSKLEWSEYFWNTLIETPFYHIWAKSRIIDHIIAYKEKNHPTNIPSTTFNYSSKKKQNPFYITWKYFMYRFFSSISFGKLHYKFDEKRKKYKKLYHEFKL